MSSTHSLRYLLSHTASIMSRQSDQVLQERLGIGMSQFRILMILRERQGVQQRLLADCLGQTEASISRQVKLLLEKGMADVQVNPLSRREHVAVITPKGEKIWQAAQDILDQYHEPAFEQLTEKQREEFANLLRVLHMHYCQEGKPYVCDQRLTMEEDDS